MKWSGIEFLWDLQIRKEDWTLGDLPIADEDQASVLANVCEWVKRFELAPSIRLGTRVNSARPSDGGWMVSADGYAGHSRFLVAATGGHNRPVVPKIERALRR